MALLTLTRSDPRLVDLPISWSNRDRREQLQQAAAESLSWMLPAAVAHTGTNFQVWDALRPLEEQIDMLQQNYRRVNRPRRLSTDRTWDGSTWERRPGRPTTASPGYSNHGSGLAIDIHPGPIQEWIKQNGPSWGWSWDEGRRVGEDWHFVHVGGGQAAGRGILDHAWVQRVVGAEVDGKIGTGTVERVRAWQAAHGLEADGIPGPATVAAMRGQSAPAPSVSPSEPAPAGTYQLDTSHTAKNYNERREYGPISQIVLHWWGTPSGQTHDGIVSWFCDDPNVTTSAHYVASPGRVSRIVDEAHVAWANGNRESNHQSITIEADPNNVQGTLPTLAALIADIRRRHGDLRLIGHRDVVPTTCPGDYYPLLAQLDAMARGGSAAPTPAPTPAPALPTGKALLMSLTQTPDFPLLRTPSHLCYYGPRSGPRESVSGHVANSLNPGEVSDGAQGLRTWQARMVKRGYDLQVDGLYGPATEAAAKNLQRLAGIAQDGKIGPDAWYAAWLWPVVA